ncbi:protein of unknown function [Filimonas lacunae]|uniref:DUF4293 family protein n=1 Tax=Filimonas lacunae TaxID=477680 RepID=A0A173MSF6_9BACT|nr:DUF4293 domain-containing protein [Filimonas lacunae]BAV10368.1 hypothetical protein FLA_6430 [Filimonas lacunae]SIT16593.1 protein of unknown function [Filimonas lacunae]
MIQRIQTIWLLVASVLAFLTLKLPFYAGMHEVEGGVPQYVILTGTTNLLITIVTVITGVAALLMIFFYKERKRQLWLTLATTLVAIVNIVLYITETGKFVAGSGNYALTSALTFVIPVFLILAIRGIRRDDKLVKSVDRLR